MTLHLFLVALGGACGAMIRFGVSHVAAVAFGRQFPYGTLIVNVVGSCLIGILYVMLTERFAGNENWREAFVPSLRQVATQNGSADSELPARQEPSYLNH